MALDSSIALQVKPLQIDNPLDVYGRAAQIKQMQQQNRLADLAFGEKQREMEEDRALNEQYRNALAPDGTIDRNKLYAGAASAGLGAKLPGIQKGFADQDKAAADALKQKIENGIKEIEFGAQVFSGVRDQATYDQARQEVARVLGPERAAQMPAQYDPVAIEANRLKALTVKDQLAEKWKALEFGQKQAEFGETVRHNKVAEGNQAGQLAVSQGQLGVAQGNLGVAQGNLAVNQQRETREGNALKDKAPPAEYAKQSEAYLNMDDALTSYKGKLQKFSPTDYLNTSARNDLGTSYQNVLLQAKELYRLGVLNGPDEGILKTIISNPLELKNGAVPKEAMLKQAEQLGEIVKNANANLAKVYGRPVTTLNSQVKKAVDSGEVSKLVDARPVSVKSAADYAKLPSGTVYMAPDGSMRTKQ